MQLDKTRIVVRERSALEIMDLSLLVLREFLSPLAITFALGAVPMALFNAWLIGWLADWSFLVNGEETFPLRFTFNMTLLIFIEAPLATAFMTAYLGKALFVDHPSVRQVVRETLRMTPRLIWCQVVVRGVGVAWMLASVNSLDSDGYGIEVLLFLLAACLALLRALRPFINEIVLLECNPLRSSNANVMTIGKRSTVLHSMLGGDLFVQWLAAAFIASGLAGAMGYSCWIISGMATNDWSWNWALTSIGLPLIGWVIAGFLAIVRFMNYLDARIRQEGWEVELRLRAEAVRMAQRLA